MFRFPQKKPHMFSAKPASLITIVSLFLASCGRNNSGSSTGSNQVRVGYIGLTCEAPIYAAYEKGFFKEEGLEPELVKCNWATYKDALALGSYDITHHLVMYFLKPIEQGLDVRFLAGIHRGCLRVQAGVNTNIHTIEDLKGKRIGVPGMGTPPFVFANRVFGTHGIDAGKDITWKVYPAGELGLAIDKGEVDAVCNAEPIGSLLIAEGKVRNIADQIVDEPYKSEYCCEVIARGKWVDANPDVAARATRALLKGAKWVETNPRAAAVMAVEKKYLASTPELNTAALARLRYIPSVQLAEESVHTASREMKIAKMLSPETDTEALAKRAFMHLPGVTDDWIKSLEVEKVAGGQVSPDEDLRLIAALVQKDTEDSCCRRKMFDQPDQDAPNLADPDAACLNKKMIAADK
jgi:NitT/TauT family transport system substrate-binding protein